MFCTKCGAVIYDDEYYCPKCGQKAKREGSAPAQESSPVYDARAWQYGAQGEHKQYSADGMVNLPDAPQSARDSKSAKNKKYRTRPSIATLIWLIAIICGIIAGVIAFSLSDCGSGGRDDDTLPAIITSTTTEQTTTAATTARTETTTTTTTATTTTTTASTTTSSSKTSTTKPGTTTTAKAAESEAQIIRELLLDGKWRTNYNGFAATIVFNSDQTADLTVRQLLVSIKLGAKYELSDDCVISFSFDYNGRKIKFVGGVTRVSDTELLLDGGKDGVMTLKKQ